MRVIAGTCRGRPLRAPAGRATRPTSDRVREAIFDVLQASVALDGSTVLDLFAGSGAMGIEALSRGASAAVFIDDDANALAVVRHNLTALGLEDRASVVHADAVTWLAGRRRSEPSAELFDLALCDPPYRFEGWGELLGLLDAELAVLESDRPPEIDGPWELVKSKRYGTTLVTVVRRAPRAPIAGSPSSPGQASAATYGPQT